MILDDVKTSLRISHSALDLEILDLIDAAKSDLTISGVNSIKAQDDRDPLIKRAIILYCKANSIADGKEAERFQNSYDLLKMHLSLAGDYSVE